MGGRRLAPKIHKIRSGKQALKSFCVFCFVDFRESNKQNEICAIKVAKRRKDLITAWKSGENNAEFCRLGILCETFGSNIKRNRTCYNVVILFPYSQEREPERVSGLF